MIRNSFGIAFVLFCAGCYTQFAALNRSVPPSPQPEVMVDSLGDTVNVIPKGDTIVARDDETCVWTRDFYGKPELRCYQSNYSHDWYLYNDYPWWYNQEPYYYDNSGRCPQYYYYDNSCGQCRYYSNWNRYPSHYSSSSYSPAPSATHAKPKKADAATVKRDTRSTGGKTYLHRVSGTPNQTQTKKQAAAADATHAPDVTPAPLPTQQTGYQAETPVQPAASEASPPPQEKPQQETAPQQQQESGDANKEIPHEQKPSRSTRGR